MIFMDSREVTLILDTIGIVNTRPSLSGVKIESGYRMMAFYIVLELFVGGLSAEVSRILANAGIAIFFLSAYSLDSVLIEQGDIAAALETLRPFVDEVCSVMVVAALP